MWQNWRNYADYYVIPHIGQRKAQEIDGATGPTPPGTPDPRPGGNDPPSVDSSLSFIRPPPLHLRPAAATARLNPRGSASASEPTAATRNTSPSRRQNACQALGPPEMDTVLDLHVDPVMATSHRQKRDR
jgi:hypothetical protein